MTLLPKPRFSERGIIMAKIIRVDLEECEYCHFGIEGNEIIELMTGGSPDKAPEIGDRLIVTAKGHEIFRGLITMWAIGSEMTLAAIIDEYYEPPDPESITRYDAHEVRRLKPRETIELTDGNDTITIDKEVFEDFIASPIYPPPTDRTP